VFAAGEQAAEIVAGDGFVRRTFVDAQTNVWTDVFYQPAFFDGEPGTPDADTTTMVIFNADGNPVVYDGQTLVTISNHNIQAGEWVRVTVRSDYVVKKWDLYINTISVAEGLGFYDAAATHYSEFSLNGAGSGTVPIDDVLIGLESPFDLPTHYTLTVISAHGDPVPGVGTNTYQAGTPINASLPVSVFEEEFTQYVFTNWIRTGSSPGSGTDSNMNFNLTENTTIEWQWGTNYWVELKVEGE
jgi:hypothetical protein